MTEYEVEIFERPDGVVDAPECTLSRKGKDSILWVNNTGHDYDVEFPDGSPFKDKRFTIPGQNGRKSSNSVRGDAALKRYEYRLIPDRVGAVAADPTVIVHDQ